MPADKGEGRPLVRFGLHGNMAVMLLEDGIDDGQSQSAAVVLGCKVRIKNLRDIPFVDAATGISDLQLDKIPVDGAGKGRDVDICHVAAVNIDGAGAGYGLLAVDNQALEDLAHLA